jgi:hypothetical protein
MLLVGATGLARSSRARLRFTVTARTVDSETLYAALSTYLLAGIFFGQIYWAIEGFRPGSIVGPDPLSELVAVYYSFVTVATLGYGDFLPRTDIARGVAQFEVIGGQLFLAVMVARLIGLFAPKDKGLALFRGLQSGCILGAADTGASSHSRNRTYPTASRTAPMNRPTRP